MVATKQMSETTTTTPTAKMISDEITSIINKEDVKEIHALQYSMYKFDSC